jgi:hemoglobin
VILMGITSWSVRSLRPNLPQCVATGTTLERTPGAGMSRTYVRSRTDLPPELWVICFARRIYGAMTHIQGSFMKKLSIAILSLFTLALPLQAAQEAEKSLYERLGGVFAIAAVIDHFSDAVVQNPVVGKTSKNPALREWHTKNLGRLPGLKFMRTLWVCEVTGGPFKFSATKPGKTQLGLEEAHRDLKISPEEFDEVAAELGRSLDFAKVPAREKGEVLAAFAAHKNEVTAGAMKQ